jgi:2,4-dienoyl-CoA reductase-like NADH-dependent reductase (Old Yellow Enzyme family)
LIVAEATTIKINGEYTHTPIDKQPSEVPRAQETAEAAIASGAADLIAFGRPFLSNAGLVEHFAHGWALNPPAAVTTWSAPTAAGYTDFPFHPQG